MPKTGPALQASLPDSSVCPACGAGLRCGVVTGDSTCWCYAMPHVIPVPSSASGDNKLETPACLCQNCLKKLIARNDRNDL